MTREKAKQCLEELVESFENRNLPSRVLDGALVKSIYIDADDCESFRYALSVIEKLEKIEDLVNDCAGQLPRT